MATNRIQDEILKDAVYKAGFPAYKVFIYGEEVSDDVISVRVNQSGGSLERMPSTCNITLVNNLEKYTLTHLDMAYIGNFKASIKSQDAEDRYEDAPKLGNYDEDVFGDDHENPVMSRYNTFSDERISGDIDIPTGDGRTSKALDINEINELAMRFAISSSEEIMYTLAAKGFTDLTPEAVEVIAGAIKEAKIKHSYDSSTEQAFFGESFTETDSDIGYNIKREVVNDKLQYTQYIIPKQENTYVKEVEGTIFNFPMQEGDCIFNLNDPVRVAFRDPFDTRLWYWMFTGFVDTWTENVGYNLDSTITITCTDVSKIARYAITVENPGLCDVNLAGNLEDIGEVTRLKANETKMTGNVNNFANLKVIDILELTFFGAESAQKSLTASFASKLDALVLIDDPGQKIRYAVDHLGVLDETAFYNGSTIRKNAELDVIIFDQAVQAYDYLYNRFNTLSWTGISAPRPFKKTNYNKDGSIGVSFKRSSPKFGVKYCVFGGSEDVDASDKSYESYKVRNLWEWNEMIHHRVKRSDLVDMREYAEDEDRSGIIANEDDLTIERIIEIIGKDKHNYPVGHGQIFYFTPAGLTAILGSDMIDRAYGGLESFHSIFKDRLSMLYDLSGELEWRFYATPKGDLVFEQPFYDLDPSDFFKNDDFASKQDKPTIEKYDTIFQEQYSGDYGYPEELTEMVFTLPDDNDYLLDYMLDPEFSYKDHFTVSIDEQHDFSNTNSDRGLVTNVRVQPHSFAGLVSLDITSEQKEWVNDKTLMPTLGFRIATEGSKVHIAEQGDGVKAYCALKLMQRNSESRNVGLNTIPKFGLMVNRPLHWRYRNYYCNIVGCSHNISWNGDVATSINTNQIRAWSGIVDSNGKPKYYHFGDGDKPFNWANMLKRGSRDAAKKRRQEKIAAAMGTDSTASASTSTGGR